MFNEREEVTGISGIKTNSEEKKCLGKWAY